VLSDAAAVAEQARGLVCEQRVAARGGEWLAMTAQTICVHSDSPDPSGALRAVRERLAHDRVVVAPI
jgi:lactam utilization protein B